MDIRILRNEQWEEANDMQKEAYINYKNYQQTANHYMVDGKQIIYPFTNGFNIIIENKKTFIQNNDSKYPIEDMNGVYIYLISNFKWFKA